MSAYINPHEYALLLFVQLFPPEPSFIKFGLDTQESDIQMAKTQEVFMLSLSLKSNPQDYHRVQAFAATKRLSTDKL